MQTFNQKKLVILVKTNGYIGYTIG